MEQGIVAHAFNPNTRENEAGGSLKLKVSQDDDSQDMYYTSTSRPVEATLPKIKTKNSKGSYVPLPHFSSKMM